MLVHMLGCEHSVHPYAVCFTDITPLLSFFLIAVQQWIRRIGFSWIASMDNGKA